MVCRQDLLVPLLVLGMAVPGVALAGKKDKKEKKSDERADVRVSVDIVFSDRDRDAARSFFVESHGRGHCPPGLAKKNNGCLPPGQAKKRYAVGRPLPAGLMPAPVPEKLRGSLGAAPAGYFYAMIDGDLVKLAVGTLLVADAIDGLVN